MTFSQAGLLGTRYGRLARNTIDYWMLPDRRADDPAAMMAAVVDAQRRAPVFESSTLRLYLHVPFCAQRCRFCAFSGGNTLRWREAEQYAALLVRELRRQWEQSPMRGRPIRSVNIGGGSPDLLGPAIDPVLEAVTGLPGFDREATEVSVELTLSTAKRAFIDRLVAHGVTKVSFGLQSLDPQVRRGMRQPVKLDALWRVLDWIDGRIPVVNADLITGLPGQTRRGVADDLDALFDEPRINALSSYLLTPGAAPALLAAVQTGDLSPMPDPLEQALMRLSTYGGFRRAGWVRHGTNTYVNPRAIEPQVRARLAGDECIGAATYETHLLAIGPQAVGSVPGVRTENLVDYDAWRAAVQRGEPPLHPQKSARLHQRDMALWTFPLRFEGLPREVLQRMRDAEAIEPHQWQNFQALLHEGLVVEHPDRYALSVLGEVFMGQLVRDLKSSVARGAVDAYIDEGHALARAVAAGRIADDNEANDRQRAPTRLPQWTGDAP